MKINTLASFLFIVGITATAAGALGFSASGAGVADVEVKICA